MRILHTITSKAYRHRIIIGIIIVCLILITALVLVIHSGRQETENEMLSHMTNPWFIAAVMFFILTCISLFLLYFLYRWKKVNIEQKAYLMPAHWIEHIEELDREIQDLKEMSKQSDHRSVEELTKINELSDLYFTAQKAMDEKDSMIKKYQKGYDAEIFRKFLRRFLRIVFLLDELKESELITPEGYRRISRLFDDALDECGVESFEPELQTDYRKLGDKIEDDPETIEVEDESFYFKVAEVARKGYRLYTATDSPIVLPSRVKIYNKIKE